MVDVREYPELVNVINNLVPLYKVVHLTQPEIETLGRWVPTGLTRVVDAMRLNTDGSTIWIEGNDDLGVSEWEIELLYHLARGTITIPHRCPIGLREILRQVQDKVL